MPNISPGNRTEACILSYALNAMAILKPTPRLLRVLRCGRLMLHLLWGCAVVAGLYPLLGHGRRLMLKQRWSRQLLDILGIRLDAILAGIDPGSLIVANHVSWLDIHVLNAARPMAFVAKEEVRQWPLVGWLAKKTDTVFVHRGRHGHARTVNTEICELLRAEMDVAIFPEGTTTDGTHLQAFFSALMQPAVDLGRPLQPVALAYFAVDGRRSLAPAYAGETTLGDSLAAILACRSLTVLLRATPALDCRQLNRRELARKARGAIAFSLGLSVDHCSATPPTLAARPGTASARQDCWPGAEA